MFKLGKQTFDFLRKIFVDNCSCIVCDEELEFQTRYAICGDCLLKLPFNNKHICSRCGTVMVNEADFCLRCQNVERNFDRVRSAFIYEGDIQRIIRAFKFNNKRYLDKYLAQHIADVYNQFEYNCDLIIPTPISKERFAERKYNQAELLAFYANKQLKLPFYTDILFKHQHNKRQTNLSSFERMENVKGVYRLENADIVKGKSVLVIDDIITTGSTLDEIAKVLKKAGAKKVEGITLAGVRYTLQMEGYEEGEDFVEF